MRRIKVHIRAKLIVFNGKKGHETLCAIALSPDESSLAIGTERGRVYRKRVQ